MDKGSRTTGNRVQAMRNQAHARGATRVAAREPKQKIQIPKPSVQVVKNVSGWLVFSLLIVGAYFALQHLLPVVNQPIATVDVKGNLNYVSQREVQKRLEPYLVNKFLEVDLSVVSDELKDMPWVEHAEVRRVWPNKIEIVIKEQLPVARWGDDSLLNSAGETFAVPDLAPYMELPQLFGPLRSTKSVMNQYHNLAQMLRPLGFDIASLEMRDQGSWIIYTKQGLTILLGRDHLVDKMRRFALVFDSALKADVANIKQIDLRYANGVAVQWLEEQQPKLSNATAVR